MIFGLLYVAGLLVAAEANFECPPDAASALSGTEGKWFIQYATPLIITEPCGFLHTVEPCTCITDNSTNEMINDMVYHVTRHYGYNVLTKKWDFLLTSGLEQIGDTNILSIPGMRPIQMSVTGGDMAEGWVTVMSCTPMKDVTGKLVQPRWMMTRDRNASEEVLSRAAKSIPREVVLRRISHTGCPYP